VTDRWVLFDLDGTLFDYEASEAAAVRVALEGAGMAVDAEVLATYRRSNVAAWAALERGETTPAALRVDRWRPLFDGAADEGTLEAVATAYVAALATGTQLVEGALEVVDAVARSHRIACITNGLADVQRPRLAASALAGYPEVVVISDEVGAAKPDPAIFDAAFERMGRPDRAAVTLVGDSLTADVAGGLGYGLSTVWYAPGGGRSPTGPAPTHRIRSLHELPPLLAQAARSS
jgi:2-haloacid dehalogenase